MKMHSLLPTISLLLLLSTKATSSFTCNKATTCQSLINYVNPHNSTSLNSITSLFQVNAISLLGANSLPLSTLTTYTFPPNSSIFIPFPCLCSNGSGVSNHTPMYTVKPTDPGLDDISKTKFQSLITYQEIGAANKMKDVNLITPGEKLWIPLPCSCDSVDGKEVVHMAHIVGAGSSVEAIGAEFGVGQDVLMKVNGILDAKSLLAGQVLDVPRTACSSSIKSASLDYSLRLANNSYAITAENCIQCSCSSSNDYQLSCNPIQGMSKTACPVSKCENLDIGNSTGEGCDASTCTYQGYTKTSGLEIQSGLVKQTCNNGGGLAPLPAGGPPRNSVGKLSMTVFQVQLLVLIQIAVVWFGTF